MGSPKKGHVFRRIGALHPVRSAHDLSHTVLTTTDMGILYPITNMCCTAGDSFTIANQVVVRLQPMLAPLLHEINAYVHWFFVPFRILWSGWEEYRTGGRDGLGSTRLTLPKIDMQGSPPPPPWLVDPATGALPNPRSNVIDALYHSNNIMLVSQGNAPIDMPARAYNKIYNDYYRDENLVADVTYRGGSFWSYEPATRGFYLRSWEKDYFTSAQPDQQRGMAPAFPLSLAGTANFMGSVDQPNSSNQPIGLTRNTVPNTFTSVGAAGTSPLYPTTGQYFKDWLNQNQVAITNAATFDVSDVRDAFQLQKYLERNQRAGYRYTEWLRARFGVSPTDARLDRPEYIGGSKSPVIMSEVLQTSEAGSTPQANMAGHGLTADATFVGKYFCQEEGVIMAILSVMPRAVYQNGLDKQWIKRNQYEFITPEFVNISEKAIERVELWHDFSTISANNSLIYTSNTTIFGYQGMYDEFRYMRSWVGGDFRNTIVATNLSYWHLARFFASPPSLNRSFVECNPDSTKRVFAVASRDTLMISFGARIKAVRPIPSISEPGLVDHH